MIKINKDLNDIPESLKPATSDFFILPNVPDSTLTTHERRMEVINRKDYFTDNYNSSYKADDIKVKLNNKYHGKCAYCEQIVEQIHVEHYRPKRKRGKDSYAYYWLAFSWDNLLLACPNCNSNKGNKFKIEGSRVRFANNKTNIKNINSHSSKYDILEKPFMINPEVTDPLGYINFSRDGKISSNHKRFKYTIEECRIDRDYLNDQRRKIINDLKEDLIAEISLCSTLNDQNEAIKPVIRKFIREAQNMFSTFLAFRNYAIRENWIKDVIQEVVN
jgi:uncharacterized protein (TIGR02646 family)